MTKRQAIEMVRQAGSFTVGSINLGPMSGKRYFFRLINVTPAIDYPIKYRTYIALKNLKLAQ